MTTSLSAVWSRIENAKVKLELLENTDTSFDQTWEALTELVLKTGSTRLPESKDVMLSMMLSAAPKLRCLDLDNGSLSGIGNIQYQVRYYIKSNYQFNSLYHFFRR